MIKPNKNDSVFWSNENEKSNAFLKGIQNYFDWSKEFQQNAAKAALRAASKLDPSQAVANVAQKAADFAKDILSLLVKGGLLLGLFKLLEYLSEKDILIFPAWLKHQAFPFVENNQTRITAAGNVAILNK